MAFTVLVGVLGVLQVNWLTPTKIRELSVLGERGMFVCNYLTQELTHFKNADVAGAVKGAMLGIFFVPLRCRCVRLHVSAATRKPDIPATNHLATHPPFV